MLIIDGEIGDNPDPNKNKIVQKITNAVAVSKRISILLRYRSLCGDVIALATFLGSGNAPSDGRCQFGRNRTTSKMFKTDYLKENEVTFAPFLIPSGLKGSTISMLQDAQWPHTITTVPSLSSWLGRTLSEPCMVNADSRVTLVLIPMTIARMPF